LLSVLPSESVTTCQVVAVGRSDIIGRRHRYDFGVLVLSCKGWDLIIGFAGLLLGAGYLGVDFVFCFFIENNYWAALD